MSITHGQLAQTHRPFLKKKFKISMIINNINLITHRQLAQIHRSVFFFFNFLIIGERCSWKLRLEKRKSPPNNMMKQISMSTGVHSQLSQETTLTCWLYLPTCFHALQPRIIVLSPFLPHTWLSTPRQFHYSILDSRLSTLYSLPFLLSLSLSP